MQPSQVSLRLWQVVGCVRFSASCGACKALGRKSVKVGLGLPAQARKDMHRISCTSTQGHAPLEVLRAGCPACWGSPFKQCRAAKAELWHKFKSRFKN